MGILDDLFRANGAQPAPAAQSQAPPATAPAQAPPTAQPSPATLPQNYADFYNRILAAAGANEKAHPANLLSWLSGSGRDAALASAAVAAPSMWQQYQTGQTGVENAQLGTARDFASTGALAGTNVDPNNPLAAIPALTAAYGGVLNPDATSPGSPQGGGPAQPIAPGGQPTPPAGNVDPVQQQRAMYLRMGRFMQIQGQSAPATEFFKLANAGLPDNTVLRPDGSVGDGVTGRPVGTDVGTLLAQRAGQVASADTAPKVAGQIKVAGNQAALDRSTSAIENADKARYDQVTGFDKTSGQPVTVSKDDFVNGRAPNFVAGENAYFGGQQAELKDLRTKSESADQGLGLAQQISNAANGIFTGKGAGTLQDVRKFALAAGQLTGEQPAADVLNDTSQFEQLKFASQQLVAVASHSLSPRVAMNIYNQISAVKPGDATSMQGLRDIINNQIVPALQRDQAVFKGTAAYYRAHPLTNDAASVVPGQNPLQKFGVRSVNTARPGDYFIDNRTGALRQRPAQ